MISNITIEELCKRLRPVIGKKADQLYLSYIMTRRNNKREEIEQLINALYNKYVSNEFLTAQVVLETPVKGVVEGMYKLGDIIYSGNKVGEFGLREEDWCRHVCISGMSGSGKTTLGFQILNNFISKNKPFVVFDWKKSFRPLMKKDKNVLCFTIGNSKSANFFKININKPPKGVDAREWINILCDVLTESFGASYGVHKILSETLDQAFSEFGVYKGSENYPTWYQIKDRLDNKESRLRGSKNRESEWLLSALRIAHALTFGEFGKVLCYKGKDGSLDIGELLNRKVIFELYSLNHYEKKFFSEFFLTYLYKLMKTNYDTSRKFKLAILVDEAHNIFLKDKPIFVKETVTDTIYREIREYGVSLICLDQHISKLSDVVAGNSACNIAFQQVLPNDVDTVANIMQIWKDKKYFSILKVGEALVKLAERHPEPFLIKVPYDISREEMISDEFIIERMQNISLEEVNKVKEEVKPKFDDFRYKYLRRFVNKQVEKGYNEKGITKMLMDNGYSEDDISILFKKEEIDADKLKKKVAFSYDQKRMLNIIKDNSVGVSEVYESLNFSARKGNQVKNELLEMGIIEVEEIKNDKGRKKILKLSQYA